MATQNYNLEVENGTFKDEKTGEVINFAKYYIDWNGLRIYLKPADQTAKQILTTLINPIPLK
jgi:hypothetical protein